jgi:hypothetical protein
MPLVSVTEQVVASVQPELTLLTTVPKLGGARADEVQPVICPVTFMPVLVASALQGKTARRAKHANKQNILLIIDIGIPQRDVSRGACLDSYYQLGGAISLGCEFLAC